MTASSMSKGFFEFVKSIGEAKSKQEEDGIIEKELQILKAKMGARNVVPRRMREYLIRMVYVEMLGHDASFAHIHAVKLTRASKLVDKRVGYMACSLCLHKDHELMLLLIGGLQTDLQSQNQLEVSTALIVICKLINNDTIPAIYPLINKLLNHNQATIRKKAIMVLQRFYELNTDSVTNVLDKAKQMLGDKDPSVMGASLHLLFNLCENNLNDFNSLVSSFVAILKQIIEHRLPNEYDYHRIPAPWIQIKLLQILAVLGNTNKLASESMYEVLREVMRRADIGINAGYAIIYECVRTVTTIYPNTQLLAEAAKCTTRFITSDNHNLKYLGINALASIVQINPSAANQHQMIVIDCLEDKDETLRRKTLDLLYKMTNENNVNVICNKLIASLKDSVDVYLRSQLVEKITYLAEKFAPDTIWFIDIMSQVFELGANVVKPQFAHNFIKTLAEGIIENQEDDDAEEDIANYAADFFYQILIKNLKKRRKKIPNILMRITSWVLGEYGQYCTGNPVDIDIDDDDDIIALSPMEIIRKLWQVIEKQGEDLSTRQWAMSATCKLCKHLDNIPIEVEEIVKKYQTSTHSGLVQLSHELIQVCQERDLMNYIFEDASIIDDIKVDVDLHFLDIYVEDQINNEGKRVYAPPDDDNVTISGNIHDPKLKKLLFHHQTDDNVPAISSPRNDDVNNVNNNVTNYNNNAVDPIDDSLSDLAASSPGLSGVRTRVRVWGDHIGKSDADNDKQSDNDNDDQKIVVDPLPKPVAVPVSSTTSPKDTSIDKASTWANLLGGTGSATTRTRRRVRKKRAIKTASSNTTATIKPKSKKKQIKQTRQKPVIPDNTKTPSAIQKQQQKPDQHDLLSFVMDNTSQPQVCAQKTVVDDLLGWTTEQNPKHQQQQQSVIDNIFGNMFSKPQQTNNNNIFGNMQNIQRGYMAVKSLLDPQIMSFPRSHDTDQVLFENSAIQISYFKVYKQLKTTLCVFITNLSSSPLSNIQISVTKDNIYCGLQLGIDVSNSIPSPQLQKTTNGIINVLNSNQTSCQMITFGLTNPTQLALPCNIVININSNIVNIGLNISDLLRSSIISTNDFGINWGKLNNGVNTFNSLSSSASAMNYINIITKKLHLHHIATIKTEIIVAGNLSSIINPNMLLPILIHCKFILNKSYMIQIRTPNMNTSKYIAKELQSLLQS